MSHQWGRGCIALRLIYFERGAEASRCLVKPPHLLLKYACLGYVKVAIGEFVPRQSI